MTTPSQAAFELTYPDRDLTQDLDGIYVALPTRMHFKAFVKDFALGEAHGRKQALEEAVAICKAFLSGGSNGIQAARVCAYNIEELLK